ncbi:unnamed protein product [Chrysoparadoxa australica]
MQVLENFDRILAALSKAGVDSHDLGELAQCVARDVGDRFRPQNPEEEEEEQPVDTGPPHLIEGPIRRLQRGVHGFAPCWKLRWVKVCMGRLLVYKSSKPPQLNEQPQLEMPLTVQHTTIELHHEVFCRSFGRDNIFSVTSGTGMGEPSHCVSLSLDCSIEFQKWIHHIQEAFTQDFSIGGPSIYRACQCGNIMRIKELVRKGAPVNRANAYGCTALHYAVKHAADSARVVAKGGSTANAVGAKVKAQEALRVVIYLMAHGADPHLTNALGETPMDAAVKGTKAFPKAKKLLCGILESSEVEASGSALYVVANKKKLDHELTEVDEWAAEKDPPTVHANGSKFQACRASDQRSKSKSKVKHKGKGKAAARAWSGAGCDEGEPSKQPLRHVDDRSLDSSVKTFKGVPVSRMWNIGTPTVRPSQAVPKMMGSRPISPLPVQSRRRAVIEAQTRETGLVRSRGPGQRRAKTAQPLLGTATWASVGVAFKDLRFGNTRVVNVGESGRRARTAPAMGSVRAASGNEAMTMGNAKEAMPMACYSDGGGGGGRGAGGGAVSSRGRRQRGAITGSRASKRQQGAPPSAKGVANTAAARIINHWMKESAKATKYTGGNLSETSRFVSFSSQGEVYDALCLLKGSRGGGELMPVGTVTRYLSSVGEALLPEELERFKKDADPTNCGYISCSQFARAITRSRLPVLPPDGRGFTPADDLCRIAKQARQERESIEKQSAEPIPTAN